MAYAVLADVTNLLKGITITNSTKVTSTNVTDWIDDYSKYLDSKLVKKYSVPITDTEGTEIMRIVCSKMVAAHVLEVIYGGAGKNVPDTAKNWKEDAKEMLNEILDEKIEVEVSSSSDITMTGRYDDNGDEREPAFEKEQEF